MSLACLLPLALLLDALIGDPTTRAHPVRLIGESALGVERIARRLGDGMLPGTLCTTLVIAFFAAVAGGSVFLSQYAHPLAPLFLAVIWIYTTVAARDLAMHANAVRDALSGEGLPAGRTAVGRIVGRDTDALDEAGVVRACIESVGENLIDGVTGALFFATLGICIAITSGASGALLAAVAASSAVAFRTINTLDATYGYRNERYERFGCVAARLDDIANWLPTRITVPFMMLAALVCKGRPLDSMRIALRDHANHSSPNSGWSEAAMAGALGVQLGGPTLYAEGWKDYPTIGDPNETLTPERITRAVQLMTVTTWLFGLACAGVIAAGVFLHERGS